MPRLAGVCPSGQRERSVKPPAQPTEVRILPPPFGRLPYSVRSDLEEPAEARGEPSRFVCLTDANLSPRSAATRQRRTRRCLRPPDRSRALDRLKHPVCARCDDAAAASLGYLIVVADDASVRVLAVAGTGFARRGEALRDAGRRGGFAQRHVAQSPAQAERGEHDGGGSEEDGVQRDGDGSDVHRVNCGRQVVDDRGARATPAPSSQ
jgi:hypothetical protein